MDAISLRMEQIKYQGAMRILEAAGSRTVSTHTVTKKTSVSFGMGFGSVTLLEQDVRAYYGTAVITGSCSGNRTAGCKTEAEYETIDKEKVNAVELPESYDTLKDCNVYYHGELISEYELVQTAVAGGKLEITEDMKAFTAYRTAFQVMIQDQAETKYAWSGTKYSEDGRYTFTKNQDGTYNMHLVEDTEMGASLEEIANWICSGTPNRNIETRYLTYLRSMDPELYNAAQNIGKEVRTYNLMTVAYDAGALGDAQHDYDLSLLGILFGERNLERMYRKSMDCKESGNYLCLLEQYDLQAANYLANLRQEQIDKTGGIL